jgi:hypothetical protein
MGWKIVVAVPAPCRPLNPELARSIYDLDATDATEIDDADAERTTAALVNCPKLILLMILASFCQNLPGHIRGLYYHRLQRRKGRRERLKPQSRSPPWMAVHFKTLSASDSLMKLVLTTFKTLKTDCGTGFVTGSLTGPFGRVSYLQEP